MGQIVISLVFILSVISVLSFLYLLISPPEKKIDFIEKIRDEPVYDESSLLGKSKTVIHFEEKQEVEVKPPIEPPNVKEAEPEEKIYAVEDRSELGEPVDFYSYFGGDEEMIRMAMEDTELRELHSLDKDLLERDVVDEKEISIKNEENKEAPETKVSVESDNEKRLSWRNWILNTFIMQRWIILKTM